MKYLKTIAVALTLFTSMGSASAAEGTGGHGGNGYGLEFQSIVGEITETLMTFEDRSGLEIFPESGFTVAKFSHVGWRVKIETTNRTLWLKGERKDAISYPETQRTVLSLSHWKQMPLDVKQRLVLHEVCLNMGLDDDDGNISLTIYSIFKEESDLEKSKKEARQGHSQTIDVICDVQAKEEFIKKATIKNIDSLEPALTFPDYPMSDSTNVSTTDSEVVIENSGESDNYFEWHFSRNSIGHLRSFSRRTITGRLRYRLDHHPTMTTVPIQCTINNK